MEHGALFPPRQWRSKSQADMKYHLAPVVEIGYL